MNPTNQSERDERLKGEMENENGKWEPEANGYLFYPASDTRTINVAVGFARIHLCLSVTKNWYYDLVKWPSAARHLCGRVHMAIDDTGQRTNVDVGARGETRRSQDYHQTNRIFSIFCSQFDQWPGEPWVVLHTSYARLEWCVWECESQLLFVPFVSFRARPKGSWNMLNKGIVLMSEWATLQNVYSIYSSYANIPSSNMGMMSVQFCRSSYTMCPMGGTWMYAWPPLCQSLLTFYSYRISIPNRRSNRPAIQMVYFGLKSKSKSELSMLAEEPKKALCDTKTFIHICILSARSNVLCVRFGIWVKLFHHQ